MAAAMFALQRLTALILAPLVIVHLVVILVAVEGGLSAAEILERTRGSVGWALFYGLFVVAASIHAPIGLRSVLREHAGWSGRSLDVAMALVLIMLLVLGFRAVFAVVGAP
jgi:fumarate reductase subunit C